MIRGAAQLAAGAEPPEELDPEPDDAPPELDEPLAPLDAPLVEPEPADVVPPDVDEPLAPEVPVDAVPDLAGALLDVEPERESVR